MSIHLQIRFWESLNFGFLENDFLFYTKVILKCQPLCGSCLYFFPFFFLMSGGIFSRISVLEIKLVFWGNGNFLFFGTLGFEQNVEYCYNKKLNS